MKNENKGFTLIELLIVVAVMAALGTIITVSLTNVLGNTNQSQCDEFVKQIEDAACVYAGLSDKEIICYKNNCDPIRLNLLIKEGLIDDEIDVCTGKNIDINETVTVSWDDNGEKKCTYNGVKVYES